MASDNSPRNLLGRILYELRSDRMRDGATDIPDGVARSARGRPKNLFSQPIFYDRCGDAERASLGHAVSFNSVTTDTKKKRISDIEHVGPHPGQEEYLCAALDLPPSFLRRGFETVEDALAAAKLIWTGVSLREKPTGFLRVDAADLKPDYRGNAFGQLRDFAALALRGDPSLCVVEGRTGVGKSFLISQWLWSEADDKFDKSVSIDCAGQSFDQVAPQVWKHFGSKAQASNGIKRLLILDGLRIDHDRSGIHFIQPDRRAHVDELIRLINRLWEELGNIAIVLAIENNEQRITRREVAGRLLPEAGCFLCHLEPFDEQTGARFLLARGLNEVSEEDRRRLSVRRQGLPIALAATADEIFLLSRIDREKYLADVRERPAPESSGVNAFHDFFRGWLDRHGTGAIDQSGDSSNPGRAHPHALLRLLALMAGPVTLSELEELIDGLEIPRIFGRDIDYLVRGELPFVSILDSGQFELHTMAVQYLRDELAVCISTNVWDEFTSRAQLEAIHWKAAQIRRRSLARELVPDPDTIGIVEAFVYHMAEQIRLIPLDDPSRRHKRKIGSLSQRHILEFEKRPGALGNSKLWLLAFYEVNRFLLDSQKASTRVYGQFEAKARILTQLVQIAESEGIKIPPGSVDIKKEIALSWMHAGRLQLALHAFGPAGEEAVDDWKRTKTNWRLACDRVSVEIAIRSRMADETTTLEKRLEPLLADATRLALNPDQAGIARERPPMNERGAIRVLCRAAEVALQAGKLRESLMRFEQVASLQKHWAPRILTGEAARRYAVALVRDRMLSENALHRAKAIIAANIELLRMFEAERGGKVSNDLISFLIMEVGLARVAGEFGAAVMGLALIRQEGFVQRGETTFQARAEFELEELRLDIAQEHPAEEVLPKAKDFAGRMKASGHLALHLEASIIVAELMSGPERDSRCDAIKAAIRRNSHRMREEDLKIVKEGKSPTIVLGF